MFSRLDARLMQLAVLSMLNISKDEKMYMKLKSNQIFIIETSQKRLQVVKHKL